MKYVVLVNGPAGAGKDTFESMCSLIVDLKYHGKNVSVTKMSAVDRVKQAASYLGWDRVKTDESRKMLSDLKDFADQHILSTAEYLISRIDKHTTWGPFGEEGDPPKATADIIFIDIREAGDASSINSHYEESSDVTVIGVYISRESVIPVNSNRADVLAQEWNPMFPYRIHNDGTYGELMDEAEGFLELLLVGNRFRPSC